MTRRKKFTQRLLSGLMAALMSASMVLDVLPTMAAYNDMSTTTYPRAKLVMDFLGDNKSSYYNDGGPAYTGTGGSGAIVQPADHDMQWQRDPVTGVPVEPANGTKWDHYVNGDQGTGTQTILWVGIGIEDVDSFVVANKGKGLYSAELGLVYDTNYLEPYVDPTYTDFQGTIAHYNIGTNTKNQWPAGYQVTEALAGVAPRNDDIDALAVGDPTIERYGTAANGPAGYGTQEFGAAAGWKMVYLSFEQKAGATNTRFTDTASYDKEDTYYIAMVPFLLKDHPDAKSANVDELRIRLVRNAAVFSMASDKVGSTESNGAGQYGDGEPSFGNWDKYTYHDPQHDLKLMLDYTGDLNLFTGKRVRDEMKAALLVRNVSASTDNYARLIINNEPLPSPSQMVSGDGGPGYGNWVNHGTITGLSGGEELRISIHAATGYTAALTVTTTTGQTITVLPVATPDFAFTEEHTFIMPTLAQKDGTVTVNVEFSGSGSQDTPFDATLEVDDGGYSSDPKAARNDAQMSFSPAAADRTQILRNGSETIRPTAGTVVTVTVHRHRDYTFYPGTTPPASPPALKITDSSSNSVTYSQVSSSVSSDGMVYTHTYTFTMPSSDVKVEVDFHQAQKHTATVLINADNGVADALNWALLSANGDPANTAKVKGDGSIDPAGGSNSFSLTDGRIVTVETGCAPGYEVKRIEFRDGSGIPISTMTATPLPGSPGNYTFVMPAHDVQVIVHVDTIQAYKVKLVIVDGDQAFGEGAGLSHSGTVPTPTDLWLTQAQVYALQGGDTTIVDILKALAGAQISVVPTYETTPGNATTRQVGLRPGRTIAVDVKYPSPTGPGGWDTIIPSGSASAGYSFNMIALNDPANDEVVVTVTFKDESKPSLTARIVEERQAATNAATTALWQVYHHKNDIAAYEGDSLVVDIHLEPGDYIAGVIIEDFSGIPLGVPYTLTGIGYNNGAGGNEVATFEMQNVNTAIRIIYGHGIPDPEPTFRATTRLEGVDGLNVSGISADVTTRNETTGVQVGPINPAATVTAKAGDAITSRYTIGTNVPAIYVQDVVVTADVPGTVVSWSYGPGGEIEINNMPAANVTVTIKVAQADPAKDMNLILAKDETAVTTLTPNPNPANVVSTTVSGGTATTSGTATTTAQPGEFVRVKVDVDSGYHIRDVVVSDGTPISHSLSGTGYNGGAGGTEWVTFTMPDPGTNTTVTVYYGEGAPANTLTVKVTEPGGGNSADLAFGGTTGTATMAAPWGPNVVAPGTLVTVEAKPQAGYFLDLPILETPTGLIGLSWVAPNTFTFTMPTEPLTVTVPFDNDPAGPDQFYANLILRPDGTSITSLPTGTKGSFEAATGSYVRLDANNCLYARTALPGEDIPYSVRVPDGYYISDVSVTPASLGVMPTITGMIGKQRGDFTMPAANVYLNITISKGWPDQVEYPVRLHVTAPAPNASPAYSSATLENLTPGDTQGTVTVPGDGVASAVGLRKAKDGDKMQVVLLPGAGHTLKSIRLEDGSGAEVSYTWTTDGSGHLALEFSVPGSSVDVYVEYEKGSPTAHTVTLHTTGVTTETVTLTNTNTAAVATQNGSFSATFGDRIDLTVAANGSTALITSAYAVASDGTMVSLGAPALQGAFVDAITGPYGFGMPFDVDVDVYLTFAASPKPGPDEHILTLLARGDTGSGTVLVTDTVANKNMSATATGSNAMVAKDNAKITAKVTPTGGYALYSLIAYLDDGTRVLVSLDNTVTAGDTYTFTMPAHTTHIEAEFRAVKPNAYQIQVVVNNTVNGGLGLNNDANLYQPIGAVASLGKFKAGVSAGETFDLGFSIDPGYQLDTIVAIPQGSGVVANIPLPTTVGGRTQVKMPASDLVIYVTFKMDTTTRFDVIGKILYDGTSAAPVAGKGYNEVTLTGETSNPITDSVYSGADAGGVNADDALIQEAADKRVEATWKCATGYAVDSYEVVTAVGNQYVLSQPFDNDGDGIIDGLFFMMQTEPIEVRVTFVDTTKDQPKDFTATLHYVTPDGDDGATLAAPNRTPAAAYSVSADAGVIHNLHVGDKLDVTGNTNASGWIRTVYVLQRTPAAANGQMIYTHTFPGGTQVFPAPDIHFFMPSGDVDVYVVFSATQPQPNEYTATLTVSGPASTPPAANYAVLEELDGAGNPSGVTTGGAGCNQGPKSMVTTAGKTIRLTVTVDAAHEIDTINGTPISLLLVPDPVAGSNGLVYTFTMPASDVGIMVILKEKTSTRYDLHLYTKNINGPDADANETTVSYGTAPGESLTNIGTMPTGSDPVPTLKVPAGRPVTLTVKPIAGYYVDAAYAVTNYGLVQLTPDPATRPAGYTGSRLTDVGLEGATVYDIASDTNIAIFTMPAATTDVYVHYKQGTPPTTPWYNLVVIATDTGAPTANVGVNYAAVAADDGAVPTPTLRFKPNYAADGYTLTSPATEPYAVASTGMGATYYSLSAGDAIHMNATNTGVYTVGTTNYIYQYDANIGMVLTPQAAGVVAPVPVNEDSSGHPRGELQGFPMPASNLSVRVNFETVRAKNLWAGLHVTYNSPLDRDTDSWHTDTNTGNKVEMSVNDPNLRSVNNDYDIYPEDNDHNRLKDLVANETVATVAWPVSGVKVLQVVVTRIADDGTPLSSTVAVNPGGNSYTYVMGDESVEVYVVLAKDDADHYVAYATANYLDGLTHDDGWLVPLADGGGVTNETTTGLPNADFWTEVQPDDQVKTVFEAKPNVYAEAKAYRVDNGIETEIPSAQFGVGNGSRGHLDTQVPNPGSDVHIIVTFSKTPPAPQKLTLENKDHNKQTDNTAKLTIDDNTLSDKTYTLQPDTTALDPMSHLFADPVKPGTGLDLTGTKAADGYRVKQVDVKVTGSAGSITITYYWKKVSGTYQLVDAASNPVSLVMPTKTTTVTVIYDQDTEGVVPYDPDNGDTTTYPIDNHIVVENRGDYLIVTVPMLNMKSDLTTTSATSVDGDAHTFDLYLQTDLSAVVDPAAGTVTPAPTKVTDLLTFSNPKVFYEHATLPASGTGHYEYQDQYELKNFYDAEHTGSTLGLSGARFIVEIKSDKAIEADVDADSTVSAVNKAAEKATRKANAAILRTIMDNDGTMSASDKYHMYITATTHETPGAVSVNDVMGGYVDFVVPKYYAIVGKLESYAPTHIATFTADAGITGGYKNQYPFVSTLVGDAGVELWSQDFVVKLTSDWDKLQNKEITLTIEKAGHVTYTRTAIKMIANDADPENIATDGTTKLYDATARTFTIEHPIRLIAGDLDGNGAVKARDVDIISDFLHGSYTWTTAGGASAAGWANSVYNPNSLAYAADLNGDGAVTARDLDLMLESQNYGKSIRTYGNPHGLNNMGFKFYSVRRAAPRAMGGDIGFPQWAYDRIIGGSDLPEWVWDALDEELYLPDWSVQLVQADVMLPQWAIDLALNFGEMPQWAMDHLLAGGVLPDWAGELLQADVDLPQWTVDMALAGQEVPQWALGLLLAGEALPDWAQLLLETGELLPEEPLTEEEIAVLLTPELPAEGLPLPEGTEVPTEGEEMPAEGDKNPAEGEEIPAEGDKIPTEGETPNEGEKNPTEGENSPDEDKKETEEGKKDPEEGEKEPVAGENDTTESPEKEAPTAPDQGGEPADPPAQTPEGETTEGTQLTPPEAETPTEPAPPAPEETEGEDTAHASQGGGGGEAPGESQENGPGAPLVMETEQTAENEAPVETGKFM